jgi:alpha-beta hydrolase superfamily lysophospholipase
MWHDTRVTTTDDTFRGAAGGNIHWASWLPAADPTAVVVIAHGASEHLGRYEHVADHLTGAGFAVYALDHRGHGRSEGKPALIEHLSETIADVGTLIARAKEGHPGLPVFLLGHSMGGHIALSYALEHQGDIDGLLLSGPAVALEAASPATRFVARLVSAIAPGLGVFGVDPADVANDPAVGKDYAADPLVVHRKMPARTVSELLSVVPGLPGRLPALRLPLLVMHGADDKLIPLSASHMVHDGAGSEDKALQIYAGFGHESLNEPGRARILGDITAWISART